MAISRDLDYWKVQASKPTLNLLNLMYRCQVNNMLKRGMRGMTYIRKERLRA